jgi:hypothetical protein
MPIIVKNGYRAKRAVGVLERQFKSEGRKKEFLPYGMPRCYVYCISRFLEKEKE